MRMQCGDNHIRPARSIANALQNCFLIRFVHVIANIGAVTALDLQVSAHGRTELERIFCRWLPRFNLAYFFETFIGAQHRINSTKLFKLLARQHIRTPPTQRAQPRTRHHIGILVACQSALGPGRRACNHRYTTLRRVEEARLASLPKIAAHATGNDVSCLSCLYGFKTALRTVIYGVIVRKGNQLDIQVGQLIEDILTH